MSYEIWDGSRTIGRKLFAEDKAKDLELLHNDDDCGKIFRRNNWPGNDTAFSWNPELQRYGYIDMDVLRKREVIAFKKPYYDENSKAGMSMVGEGVLEADNLRKIKSGAWYVLGKKKTITKGSKMNTLKKDVNYAGGEYVVVEVTYDLDYTIGNNIPCDTYTFKVDNEQAEHIGIGDKCIVESSNGYGIVKVIKLHPRNIKTETLAIYNKAKAWVVSKVDETLHTKRIENTERKKFIVRELEERKARMQETEIYDLLAKQDPDAAKLLEELKDL